MGRPVPYTSSVAQIKGALIAARRSFVIESFGEPGWARVVASLAEEEREILGGLILAISWYPLSLATRLEETIVRELGEGDASLYEKMGRHSAKKNLKSLYSAFVATDRDPGAFFARLVRAYPQMHTFGRAFTENEGPTSIDIVHDYAGHAHLGFCAATVGFFRAASEVFAPRILDIRETRCQARGARRCVIQVTWSTGPT